MLGRASSHKIAPVPQLNKSLAQFNKYPFRQGFSHRDSDYKLP